MLQVLGLVTEYLYTKQCITELTAEVLFVRQ